MISGIVQHGLHLARTHGYPTANIMLDDFHQKPGTYAAHVRALDHTYPAAVFINKRNGQWMVEAHLLDVDLDLYGKHIDIELLSYISEVIPFESTEQMQQKIEQDITKARQRHRP